MAAVKKKEFETALEKRGWDYRVEFREYQMAFVIRTLLSEYDYAGERQWHTPDREKSPEYFRFLTNLAADVIGRGDGVEPGFGEAFLMRIAYLQWGEFEDLRRLFARAFLLYGDCAREGELTQGVEIDRLYRARCGLTIREAQAIAFGIYSIFWPGKIGPHYDQTFLASPNADFPGLSQDLMSVFNNLLSADFEEYRALCESDDSSIAEGFDVYRLNPLVKCPILRLPSELYVIPSPRLLFRRVSTGLYYDLIRADAGRFGNVIGRAVELYTKMLVEDLAGTHRIHPAQKYGLNRETSEWIIEEPHGNLVIENKRGALRQRAKTTAAKTDILGDICVEHGVLDGIKQLIETVTAIRQGEVTCVNGGRRTICLLVTLDYFYLANSPYMRGIIDEALKSQGYALSDIELQICPIPDFEDLCWMADATGEALTDILFRKLSNPVDAATDISVWSGTTGLKVREDGSTPMIGHGIRISSTSFSRFAAIERQSPSIATHYHNPAP